MFGLPRPLTQAQLYRLRDGRGTTRMVASESLETGRDAPSGVAATTLVTRTGMEAWGRGESSNVASATMPLDTRLLLMPYSKHVVLPSVLVHTTVLSAAAAASPAVTWTAMTSAST